MNKIEILSPAGSVEAFEAAIAAGADAVYLGLDSFNARMKAKNFNRQNIAKVIKRAHIFGMRVFVTLNTLLSSAEQTQALDLVKEVWQAGADAFILQDIGLASRIKEADSNIVIHASTQMGINNLEGALALEGLGFSRIILARETPIAEIKRIRKGCNVQLEYFVHGALCVAYSGNCYFSSLITGNSGNRGECLQFCRRKYTDGKNEGYLLSAKDICLTDHISELASAGITSFKIEGRLRSPAYVYNTVTLYKQALTSDKNLTTKLNKVKQAFNRGDFSNGYLTKADSLIDSRIQGHMGLKVGEVRDVVQGVAKIRSTHEFALADGVKFIRDGQEIGGMGCSGFRQVSNGVYELKTKLPLKAGDGVFITLNSNMEQGVGKLKPTLPVKAEFWGYAGKALKLKLTADTTSVVVESDTTASVAQNTPTTEEQVTQKLNKLNDTDFSFVSLKTNLQDNVFIPASAINNLRRDAIQKLGDQISVNYINKRELGKPNTTKPTKLNASARGLVLMLDDHKKLGCIDLSKINTIVFSPAEYTQDKTNAFMLALGASNYAGDIYLDCPIIASGTEIKLLTDIITTHKLDVFANNYYAIQLAKQLKTKLMLGFNMNIFNQMSLEAINNIYPISAYCYSVELSVNAIGQSFEGAPCGAVYAYGNFPLMYLKHCPKKEHLGTNCNMCKEFKQLEYIDERKENFIIRRKQSASCFFELLNGHAINVLDKVAQLKQKALFLDLTLVATTEAGGVVRAFSENLKGLLPNQKYTNGLLFRGVK